MKRLILAKVAILFIITGCVSQDNIKDIYDKPGWPGHISSSVSEFDNTSYISMVPAYLAGADSLFRVGLSWSSQLEDEIYMLSVEWGGAKNFDPEKPLTVNIDGSFIDLIPVSTNNYGFFNQKKIVDPRHFLPGGTSNQTMKYYWVTEDLISKMIDADKVVFKAHFLNSIYIERLEPTENAMSTYNKNPGIWAKSGFKNFLAVVERYKSGSDD